MRVPFFNRSTIADKIEPGTEPSVEPPPATPPASPEAEPIRLVALTRTATGWARDGAGHVAGFAARTVTVGVDSAREAGGSIGRLAVDAAGTAAGSLARAGATVADAASGVTAGVVSGVQSGAANVATGAATVAQGAVSVAKGAAGVVTAPVHLAGRAAGALAQFIATLRRIGVGAFAVAAGLCALTVIADLVALARAGVRPGLGEALVLVAVAALAAVFAAVARLVWRLR